LRSSEKKPKGTDRAVKSMRGGGLRAGDADSQLLQKISKNIGNDVLSKHLDGKSAQRDQILAFICSRLKTVSDIQSKERSEMKNERAWYKEVAKGVKGFHLPDPTRWHECARFFQKAGKALCEGHLGKGVQLLNKALEHERAAFDSIPKMVEVRLDEQEKTPNNTPLSSQSIDPDESCPSVTKPKDLSLADHILNIRDQMEATPPIRPLDWWETKGEEEEEEEEEEET
jgi:hypothetical protein